MKVGAENRTKLIVAIALLAVAAVLLGNWLFSSSGTSRTTTAYAPPDTTETQPAVAHPKPGTKGKKNSSEARSLDPRLRLDWLKGSEDVTYSGNGRNIFQTYVEIPKPIINPARPQEETQTPAAPPPPPPINLSFFGFASRPGEAKKIFLAEGEDIFIAAEGQIVDRRYKVLHISPDAVEIEDVLNNNRQSIPLTRG